MKTILFACSYEFYKAVISMPSMVSGFSIEDIRKATDKPLPNLSQGYFTIISRSNNCQVALFKYKVMAGLKITSLEATTAKSSPQEHQKVDQGAKYSGGVSLHIRG